MFAGQMGSHYPRAHHSPMLNPSARILPHPMSALSQLSSQIGQGSFTHGSPSSSGSQSATPSPSSSAQEEEAKYHSKVHEWEQRITGVLQADQHETARYLAAVCSATESVFCLDEILITLYRSICWHFYSIYSSKLMLIYKCNIVLHY